VRGSGWVDARARRPPGEPRCGLTELVPRDDRVESVMLPVHDGVTLFRTR
jgi:hypothetical protein